MAKYLHIQVNNPCTENWDNMHPVAGGNYCDSCKKTVVDFTGMTDNQLLEYFKKPGAASCGRFSNDQLEQPLLVPQKKLNWLKYVWQVSLPALLFAYRGQAQSSINKNQHATEIGPTQHKPVVSTLSELMVNGKVTGLNGEAIPFASVMIEGGNEGAAADSNGIFNVKVNSSSKILLVSAVGYKEKRVAVSNSFIDVELEIGLSNDVLVYANTERRIGKFTAGGISIVTRCTINSITSPEVESVSTINLFPNPAQRNGQLNIRFLKPVTHNQQLTIYNAAGVALQQQLIQSKSSLQQTSLQLRLSVPGTYMVVLIDVNTKERRVGRLVVVK